jgi:HicB-like protein involved in pilus formation
MDLTPYIEGLQRDLATTAEPGGPEVKRAAELLGGSIEASARLTLLEALSDAAAEITTKLSTATVDVRLRGRQADLIVTELAPSAPVASPVPPLAEGPVADGGGDLARITLRLPEGLKEQAERAAASEGISVNAWLVRAVAVAISGRTSSQPPFPGVARPGRRLSGYAQA